MIQQIWTSHHWLEPRRGCLSGGNMVAMKKSAMKVMKSARAKKVMKSVKGARGKGMKENENDDKAKNSAKLQGTMLKKTAAQWITTLALTDPKDHEVVDGDDDVQTALAMNDFSPLSKEQRYVWKKTLPKMSKQLQDLVKEQKRAAGSKQLRCGINAIVPKHVKYASEVDCNSKLFKQVCETCEKTFTKNSVKGMARTEMEAKRGSEERVEKGIRRGDIQEGDDGFFYWRRKEMTEIKGTNEVKQGSRDWTVKDDFEFSDVRNQLMALQKDVQFAIKKAAGGPHILIKQAFNINSSIIDNRRFCLCIYIYICGGKKFIAAADDKIIAAVQQAHESLGATTNHVPWIYKKSKE